MSKYRHDLPQLGDRLFLTDSGLETILCFLDGIDLPEFAAFPLMDTSDGRRRISDYMEQHIRIAVDAGLGFVLETPTWRASRDWGTKLGYSAADLDRVNRDSVAFMAALRDRFETPASKMVISGNIGPRGDGYAPESQMDPRTAKAYHAEQIASFANAGADMVTTLTMTHIGEAAGIALAARAAGIPSVISFTTETDGRIPAGETLGEAIQAVDDLTGNAPAYYMINCAHPTHFETALDGGAGWIARVRGLRANASTKSHEELDCSTELDQGNPVELGEQYRELLRRLPYLTVLGGCCGTDHRHVEAICTACLDHAA